VDAGAVGVGLVDVGAVDVGLVDVGAVGVAGDQEREQDCCNTELVAPMTPKQAVQAYVARNLRVAMGGKVHLHQIRAHFLGTARVPEDKLGMDEFKKILKHTIMTMPPGWGNAVLYKKFMIDGHIAKGYLNLAWTRTTDNPRIDAGSIVQDYVKRHLEKQSGSSTSQHDIYEHFLATVQGSVKCVNTPTFYKVLAVAVNSILGAENPIQHDNLRLNGKDRCMRFVGVGFVDAREEAEKHVPRRPPKDASQKYRLCVCVCVCGREDRRKRERERESER